MKIFLKYDAIHEFSIWLRTGSNPEDINRIGSHTGKNNTYLLSMFMLDIFDEFLS